MAERALRQDVEIVVGEIRQSAERWRAEKRDGGGDYEVGHADEADRWAHYVGFVLLPAADKAEAERARLQEEDGRLTAHVEELKAYIDRMPYPSDYEGEKVQREWAEAALARLEEGLRALREKIAPVAASRYVAGLEAMALREAITDLDSLIRVVRPAQTEEKKDV